MKLSRMLLFAAATSLVLAVWSLATLPITKISTEFIVKDRLPELIDRSQLSVDKREALDQLSKFLLSNDKRLRESHKRLYSIATYGFTACAIVFAVGAVRAYGLEKRAAFPWLTT